MRRGPGRNRWWGWMALVAIWLTVLAPTISRSLPSAFAFPELGAWCDATPGERHDTPAVAGDDACAYCTLFAQAPLLGSSFFTGLPARPADALPAAWPAAGQTAPVARFHAPPRGPPAVATA